jgi:tetratricopeptide (TPR) repeat protein
MTGSTPLRERLRTRAGIAVVLGAVMLFTASLYLPALRYGFVWDDTQLITYNQLLSNTRPGAIFQRGFWAGGQEKIEGPAGAYYRPLVTLSFWLDLKLHGEDPFWFHMTNLILNALAAAVVTLVLWELLHSGVWALFGGLLFGAHSSHVESVAFVSGRTDVMLTLFIGLAAFCLLRSLRKRDRRWWFAVPPLFGLALLCKEAAIMFPLLVGFAPLLTQTRYDRRYWMLVAATIATAVGWWFLRVSVVPAALPVAPGVPLVKRLTDIANTFGLYVGMFFWPIEHKAKFPATTAFYNLTPNTIFALLFLVSGPLIALKRRFGAALWGYAWAVAFLLPVANIVSIGPQAAERLLYLPSAGLVILLVTVLSRLLFRATRVRQLAATGLAVVTVLLGADTMNRSRIWQSQETLFSAMVREAPTAPSAYANLADAIAVAQPDSAIKLYDRAIFFDRGYVHAHVNAAILMSRKGDHRQAIHYLRVANEIEPGSARVLSNLGLAFSAAGEPDSALAALDRALAVDPGSALVRLNRAGALLALSRRDEAKAELQQALELDPKLTPARLMLADYYEKSGKIDSAVAQMDRLAAEQPAPAHFNRLGSLLVSTGDSVRAERCYTQALKLDSMFLPALYNQSIILAQRGDTTAALKLASRAYRLRPDLEAVKTIFLKLGGRQ